MLFAIVVLVFGAVAAILLCGVMPQPMKPSDYLVVGSVATLVSLLVLFFLLATTVGKSDLFLKRRKKQ